jgi:ribosomal protein L44E
VVQDPSQEVFRKKAKTTKKVTIKLECGTCKIRRCKVIRQDANHSFLEKKENTEGQVLFSRLASLV